MLEKWPYLLGILLSWGLWGFLPKLAVGHLDPKSALFWQVMGSLAVGLSVLWSLNFRPAVSASGITFALLTGIAGQFGALLLLRLLVTEKASSVVVMTAFYPVVTILLAVVVLGESLSLRQGIGIAFAFIALVLFAG